MLIIQFPQLGPLSINEYFILIQKFCLNYLSKNMQSFWLVHQLLQKLLDTHNLDQEILV